MLNEEPVPSSEHETHDHRPIQCPRCGGLRIAVRYSDWARDTVEQTFRAWKCVLCGDVTDPVIATNRRRNETRRIGRQGAIASSVARPEHLDGEEEDEMSTGSSAEIHRQDYSFHESTIISLLDASDRLTIDEILERAPHLSWSQVFLAIDVLSRKGNVTLYRKGFEYSVETARHMSLAGGSDGKTAPHHR
jgi:hypothetical protein